ncbi:uncharacterized protein LOC118435850 [Folsomia candida]|nr:uncharacterized protein LOC118435850 [Folsomia candida]
MVTISRIIIYPSAMIELWINILERKIRRHNPSAGLDHTIALLQQYRIAQLTVNLVSAVLAMPYLSIFLTFTMVGEVSALYIIISSWAHLPVEAILLFLLLSLDFFVVIHIMLHSLSLPNTASIEFLKNGGKILKLQKIGRKDCFLLRKYLRSFPPLKVGMGGGKYWDKRTSLTVWQFCVDRLINLLLYGSLV